MWEELGGQGAGQEPAVNVVSLVLALEVLNRQRLGVGSY